VKRQLGGLNWNKATGPHGVSPRVLKACAEELCGIFQHLFNLSLRYLNAHLGKSMVESTVCFVAICRASSIRVSNSKKLNKLTKAAGSALGTALEPPWS